jgi:hypothetical protein
MIMIMLAVENCFHQLVALFDENEDFIHNLFMTHEAHFHLFCICAEANFFILVGHKPG